MDLAPVLDTASPADTVAGESYRSFSENGGVAASYGLAYAKGLRAAGVVPVAKHFPGLGHASADTDNGPATDPPLSQLETDDLIPFEQAAAAGLPVVMVGHPMVPGLTGSVPASLSPAAYQFLRTQVGFGGVAMTDDLDAGAISAAGYTQPAAAVRAIESGADMAMIDAGQWSATVSALTAGRQQRRASRWPRSTRPSTRILAAKGIPVCSGVTYAPGSHGSLQELFAVNASGQVQTNYELPNGTWAGWHSLGGQNLLGGVTYAPGSHGSLQELFAVNASGQVQTNYELPNGTWAGWHSLGGQNLLGGVTYAPGSHGSLQELFAVNASGQVQTNYELPNGTWAGWHSLGGQNLLGGVTYAPGSHGSLQELFAVNASGQVQTNYELPNGTWAGWHSLGGQNLLGGVTYAPGSHGSLQELFAVSASGQVQTNYELPNGTWAAGTAWAAKTSSAASPTPPAATAPSRNSSPSTPAARSKPTTNSPTAPGPAGTAWAAKTSSAASPTPPAATAPSRNSSPSAPRPGPNQLRSPQRHLGRLAQCGLAVAIRPPGAVHYRSGLDPIGRGPRQPGSAIGIASTVSMNDDTAPVGTLTDGVLGSDARRVALVAIDANPRPSNRLPGCLRPPLRCAQPATFGVGRNRLLATSGASGTSLLAAWTEDGGVHWAMSPSPPAVRRPAAQLVGPAGGDGLFVLISSSSGSEQLDVVDGPGASLAPLVSPPAGTATVAFGPARARVAGPDPPRRWWPTATVLTVWTLDRRRTPGSRARPSTCPLSSAPPADHATPARLASPTAGPSGPRADRSSVSRPSRRTGRERDGPGHLQPARGPHPLGRQPVRPVVVVGAGRAPPTGTSGPTGSWRRGAGGGPGPAPSPSSPGWWRSTWPCSRRSPPSPVRTSRPTSCSTCC